MCYEKEQLFFYDPVWYYSGTLLFHTSKLPQFTKPFSLFNCSFIIFTRPLVEFCGPLTVFDYQFDKFTSSFA
jgi:hypothetical protein